MARRPNETSEPAPDETPTDPQGTTRSAASDAPAAPTRRRPEPVSEAAEGPETPGVSAANGDNAADPASTATAPAAAPAFAGGLRERRIGLIGAGTLGSALCRGLIQSGAVSANRILVSDTRHDVVQSLRDTLGIRQAESNIQVARYTDLILLATPGAAALGVMEEIAESLRRDAGKPAPLLISLAEGVPLSELESRLKDPLPVVRALSSLPVRVGRGVSVYTGGAHVEEPHLALTAALFEAVGTAQTGSETLLDTVSALTCGGSAPVFLLIEAMIEAAALAGLSRDLARTLTARTVAGAAHLLLETDLHPAHLRDLSAPPGGNAVTVIADLERSGVRGALIDALSRAMPPLRDRS